MGFDCSKCLAACKADCCHQPVPMENSFIDSHKPVRPILLRKPLGSNMSVVIANDERKGDMKDGKIHGVCPFLGLDDRCSVYEDRPYVCRRYGDESSMMMVCSFQAKDGRVRSRQERRHIERKVFVQQEKIVERLRSGVATDSDMEVARQVAESWPDDSPEKKRARETGSAY